MSYVEICLRFVARRLLKSLSIKQGVKYDSPESRRHIQAFIDFYNLNVDEFLDPVESFSEWRFLFPFFLRSSDEVIAVQKRSTSAFIGEHAC